ncbi:MAG: hypothetical protein L3J20_09340 [Flavobacteriaceae bacterium]|nr:hypothetical protein [Flavobacteriaceae bacterium]
MKKSHKYLIGFLVFSWISFIIWEIYVEKWAANETGPVIRVDLIIIIPVLLIITIFVLYKLFRKNDEEVN